MMPLLSEAGESGTKDKKKTEVLIAFFFFFFALIVTSKVGPQALENTEPNSRVGGSEALSLMGEDGVREYLSQLDIHKSTGSVRMLFMVLMEPANVIQRAVSIIFRGHGDQGEVPVV